MPINFHTTRFETGLPFPGAPIEIYSPSNETDRKINEKIAIQFVKNNPKPNSHLHSFFIRMENNK